MIVKDKQYRLCFTNLSEGEKNHIANDNKFFSLFLSFATSHPWKSSNFIITYD